MRQGDVLWEPPEEAKQRAHLTQYMRWLREHKGLSFADVEELWAWSVTQIEAFWASLWEYFGVQATKPYTTVLPDRRMPGARWFPGAELNYAAHIFRAASSDRPALLYSSEREPLRAASWGELRRQVAALAATLRRCGVGRGDRVAAYLPNVPQAVTALLACASIGAIWSSCSPDFGAASVLDRFRQIEPTVLLAVNGYAYNGQVFDRRAVVGELRRELPTLRATVVLHDPEVANALPDAPGELIPWEDAVAETGAQLIFEPVPFEHPLWILYSSGTTGAPKAIVHSTGGILLEQLKSQHLGNDLHAGDRFFWYTTTGWMMWNVVVGALLTGATSVLYDGSPRHATLDRLWSLAEEARVSHLGTSAGYLLACQKAGIEPGRDHDLGALRFLGSTGSPLPVDAFAWVYEHVRGDGKRDLWLSSSSGGTDVCTGFVGGCALLPVRAGELQHRALGVAVEAFDEHGHAVMGQVGELVVTQPMPSMPIRFWNDPDGKRYRESYFAMYPSVWRHGDWIELMPDGGAVIFGRSDATINRRGVRMGTSEIYRGVAALPEVMDSLALGIEQPDGGYFLPLFVVLREGVELDKALVDRIREQIRTTVSPHHVPDEVIAVPAIPYTLNGKKLEVPIKKLLMGLDAEQALTVDAVSNPEAVAHFITFAHQRQTRPPGSATGEALS
ncbi:MAG TPA: acetoacetate--CoA ligase [Ktedonobacterales bacterium]